MKQNKMKFKGRTDKFVLIVIAFLVFSIKMNAQTNINIGAGYFGHTLSYPGVVLEGELEKMFSEKTSIPLRLDIGFYSHQRYHNAFFTDLNIGFRRYLKSGIFFEESIGIGMLQGILNSDGVFKVDESGGVSEGSRILPIDLIPSVTLGMGYNLSSESENKNLIWIRPKIFWQIPHKELATFNVALQIGYTHTINSK